MSWAEICVNPVLKDLPFKIQTDKWGHIVMSPASNEHGMYQAKIIALLSRLLDMGVIISECSIQTKEGVKVADVAWASDNFIAKNRGNNPFQEAPELCIEILSPSNSTLEMKEKKELYFTKGAREFWICDQNGKITFYNNTGECNRSALFTSFPDLVVL